MDRGSGKKTDSQAGRRAKKRRRKGYKKNDSHSPLSTELLDFSMRKGGNGDESCPT